MDKHQKKQIKRYITWGFLALLVALLSVMPLLANQKAEADGPQASILTTKLQQQEIKTQIIGGGKLTSEDTEEITVPEAVKLTKYLVSNGDTVKKGDPIARVDKVSVMLALTEVQKTLDYLSEQITDAANEKESDKITAQTEGTVKIVYGKAGDNVRDVMLEHGALAVLSLDDKMAVDIDCSADFTYGKSVNVTLASGKQVKGTVEANVSGTLTVSIKDNDYAIGEAATVSTSDGTVLGSGKLYIHNPWNAAAYYGTIKKVNIKAGDRVSSRKDLFLLNVENHSANFRMLNTQRQEYEELMQQLFDMYNTGTLCAPCDGFVTGVDKDGAFLLAANSNEQNWFFLPLSGSSNTDWAVMPLSETPDGETPPTSEETLPEEHLCTKNAECEALLHELGCPKAVYTVRVAQVLPTGNVATNPEAYSNVTNLAGVSTSVALGGNVEKWPTTGLLNRDLITQYTGVAPAGSILFELSDVLGNKYYVYAGSSGSSQRPGGMGGMSSFGGFGRGGAAEAFEPYSLETITVASITSQEKMSLEISVDEQDIAKIHMGQEATVTVEALTGQTFPAIITTISNTGVNEGGSSKFTVKLTLSKSGEMLPGMNASAYLPLQSQSVIAIPVAALVEDGAKTIVFTGYDEKKETLINPVTVTTGFSDGEYVQILSGLAETDTVYYAYYDTLEYSRIPDRGLGF